MLILWRYYDNIVTCISMNGSIFFSSDTFLTSDLLSVSSNLRLLVLMTFDLPIVVVFIELIKFFEPIQALELMTFCGVTVVP